ncbi:MAG: universal stress protein [Candidatus Melainabacteria bacterium]|nr:universal stress protein [Candidatus Melainabacteria bacterium]
MKVLVAIDNKPSSQATIDALVKMNWYEGTEIALVTVFPSSLELENTVIFKNDQRQKTEKTIYHEEMEDLACELRNLLKHCTVSFFARHGDPKTVIMELAKQSNADLVVLGSNCKSTLERLLIGSVSQEVLNTAPCPVIVAKAPCSFAQDESPSFKNILLPIDNSVFSVAAVRWLSNFRWPNDTKLIVLAVVEEATDLEQVHHSLNNRAQELSKHFRSGNILTEIVRGEPQQTIIEVAKSYSTDLIVMGSHGHAGFKKLILGSVSQSVAHNAPCAVAIVRGIAGSDKSFKHTGAFDKVASAGELSFAGSNSGSGSSVSSVHSMPAGF